MRLSPYLLTRACACTLLGLLSTAASADAQSASILDFAPVEEGTLDVGAERAGALSASDLRDASDTFMDVWELNGQAGGSVTIDLVSDDFDSVLYVVGPGLGETLYDDDGGGGCHARISFTFLESGVFRVVASTTSPGQTGTYVLRTADVAGPAPSHGCGEPDPAMLAALPTDGRTLAVGSMELGRFDFLSSSESNRPVQAWSLEVTAGERITIIQRSDDFDSYLYLMGPGIEGSLGDDDGAGDLNSLIEFTPSSAGPYTVVASALTEGATGTYTIEVGEPVDLATLPTVGRLELGQTMDGFLGTADPIVVDGRRGQVWALDGQAGQRVTIELRSDSFDAFLYVAGPGLAEPLSDDDSAGDLDSRLSFELPQSGSYRVIVSALEADPSGPFTLTVGPM